MRKFDIRISVTGQPSANLEIDREPDYDPELDNIISIFADICDAMEESSKIQFVVSGFGQEMWPLDVGTDLLCGVEELGEIVEKISLGDFNFEFYLCEQGVERKIKFIQQEENVKLTCFSYTEWQPDPETIFLSLDKVRDIFYKFKFDFCNLAQIICPKLTSHQWYRDWAGESQ